MQRSSGQDGWAASAPTTREIPRRAGTCPAISDFESRRKNAEVRNPRRGGVGQHDGCQRRSGDDIQSIDAAITPTKLDKKKFKPAQIFIDIETKNNEGSDQPPSATRTIVDFPKNLKFDTTAVPNCKGTEAELQNTTTETAKEVCGKESIVSIANGTSAHVTVDTTPAFPVAHAPIDVGRDRVQRHGQEHPVPARPR